MEAHALAALTLLVVEDDYLVATELALTLKAHGARVLGPVPDSDRARRVVAQELPDCALQDVNLKGRFAFDLAEELRERGIPVIFTTGYDSSFLPASLRSLPCLQKPIDLRILVQQVLHATGAHAD